MATPLDEAARQRALDTYHLVDSLPEQAFDDIVRLASTLCHAPIALLSLIDRDRQWLKARTGFEPSETSRDIAFCDHAIRDPDQLMEIGDARLDPRFADNPFVTGKDQIRFYAGVPLVTPGGAAVGTVCVLDREPRKLDPDQRAALASLARLTMNLMEARHRERELERALLFSVDAAAPAPAQAVGPGCTVALFEMLDQAGAVARLGERAVERALQQLEQALENALVPGRGDNVSRVSGSTELILLLHGNDNGDSLRRLREAADGFEQQTSLRVLSANTDADPADEALECVFLRAEAALSDAKDAEFRKELTGPPSSAQP